MSIRFTPSSRARRKRLNSRSAGSPLKGAGDPNRAEPEAVDLEPVEAEYPRRGEPRRRASQPDAVDAVELSDHTRVEPSVALRGRGTRVGITGRAARPTGRSPRAEHLCQVRLEAPGHCGTAAACVRQRAGRRARAVRLHASAATICPDCAAPKKKKMNPYHKNICRGGGPNGILMGPATLPRCRYTEIRDDLCCSPTRSRTRFASVGNAVLTSAALASSLRDPARSA